MVRQTGSGGKAVVLIVWAGDSADDAEATSAPFDGAIQRRITAVLVIEEPDYFRQRCALAFWQHTTQKYQGKSGQSACDDE